MYSSKSEDFPGEILSGEMKLCSTTLGK